MSYNRIMDTKILIKKTFLELMADIVCHAAAHPVNGLAEEQTLVIVDHYLFVFVIYGSSDAEFFEISSDHFITDLHEIMD